MSKLLLTLLTIFCAVIFNACSRAEEDHTTDAAPVASLAAQTPVVKSEKKSDRHVIRGEHDVIPSDILESVNARFLETDGISAAQLADFANKVLQKDGFDFTFDWTPEGKKNDENLAKLGELIGGQYYPFDYRFTDTKGKALDLHLMNDSFAHPCYSTIKIPVTNVNRRTIKVVTGGGVVELKIPVDFRTEQIVLVDESLKKMLRTWNGPIDGLPAGISEDGTKIYFDKWSFRRKPMDDSSDQPIELAVELSANGDLRFIDAHEIASDEGADIENKNKFREVMYRRFTVDGRNYIVTYAAPCT